MSNDRELILQMVDLLRTEHTAFELESVIENLEESIESYGVKVYYSDMNGFENPSDISGYSQITEEGFPIIVINAYESSKRQRFTMAHELGHIILHWGWNNEGAIENPIKKYEILYRKSDINKRTNNRRKEYQANEFAAELLIPKDFLLETFPMKNEGNRLANEVIEKIAINNISESLKVSEPFTKIQINKYREELNRRISK